jgi:preprotein translocase subunit SecG
MDGRLRWVVAIVAVAALVGLVLLARGQPDHGGLGTVVMPLLRVAIG